MSALKMDNFLVDVRIVQRNISVGRIERKAYDEHLNSLKDLTDQASDIGEKVFGDGKAKIALTGEFSKEDKDYE